jgi:hypothetical protein
LDNAIEWYQEHITCYVNKDNTHNFIPVSYIQSQYMKQATTLMCSHCLQLIELRDVQDFNTMANSLETSDSV